MLVIIKSDLHTGRFALSMPRFHHKRSIWMSMSSQFCSRLSLLSETVTFSHVNLKGNISVSLQNGG